jgi:hypothetical protein
MAENEELDLSKARRWQSVLHAVGRNEPAEAVAEKARECLYRTFRSLKRKIPLNRLVEALDGGSGPLERLARECSEARDYAQLFLQEAAEAGTRRAILERSVGHLCDTFLEQIIHRVVPSASWHSISVARSFCKEVLALLQGDVEEIAAKLDQDPNWRPRKPRRRRDAPARDKTKDMLRESLLEGGGG